MAAGIKDRLEILVPLGTVTVDCPDRLPHGGQRGRMGFVAFLPGRIGEPGVFGSAQGLRRRNTTLTRVRWAFSGKKKSDTLLQDLGWFVDKLHELVPNSRTNQAIIQPGTPEQLTIPPPEMNAVLHLAGRSRVDRAGGIKRKKKKHTRRIAAMVAKDTEHKVRVDERKQLERQAIYFDEPVPLQPSLPTATTYPAYYPSSQLHHRL
ncbi:hypothetical protein BDD12DRAFT_808508 [Trichophaea hybrida]|nr:hypothetical protein BDD12DRAFT_808508 [Trichophaea hybrida]